MATEDGNNFDSVRALIDEHRQVEAQLGDPDVHADQGRARKLGRRYAELEAVKKSYDRWHQLTDDLQAARELAGEDSSFTPEVAPLQHAVDDAAADLRALLAPRDPDDGRDAILEIKAGAGGDESALFAGDLLRMYTKYAESLGWRVEVLDSTEGELGGYKNVSVGLKSSSDNPAEGVWARMKFEGGVHRVQRVPVTESQGRIHTSAAGVMVFPEVDTPDEVEIHQNDLRIDVYRSSGPGGQSVNTTDSAVRITHLPTGVVVNCQNEKSQLQNKEQALRILRARLLAREQEEAEAAATEQRRSQVKTFDRSERIRTYNFPENRIVDHRTGYKAYNLDHVLDGDLEPVIQSCAVADQESRMDETLDQ